MPGFMNILRGGIDTVGRAKRAHDDAETEDQQKTLSLLEHFQNGQRAQELQNAQLAHVQAQTARLNRPDAGEAFDTVVGDDGLLYRVGKRSNATVPLTAPDTVPAAPPRQLKRPAPSPRPAAAPKVPGPEKPVRWQLRDTPQGTVQVNPITGETRPVQAPGSTAQMQPKETGAIISKIAQNHTQTQQIDQALAALNQHPNAVGLIRGHVDAADSRLDPEGVNARALIANVGSLTFHDRSGAAVTPSEAARLRPFIPSASDNAATVRRKLASLRAAIETETGYLERNTGGVSATFSGERRTVAPADGSSVASKYGVTPSRKVVP